MSEYATMAFVLYFPIVILVYLNAWLIIFESFFFQRLHKIRSFSVKENEAVFWRHKI